MSILVAISGRSGSGKTTVVKNLIKILGKENVCYLHQDSYYKDQSHIPYEERERINYDHPDTIEMELFAKHLQMLSKGKPVNKPIYDFVTHTRKRETEKVIPKKIIIADGIHVLTKEAIRKIIDIKVYVDTDPDISFIRRLLRDTKERGRSVESVINQYITTVKPMQGKYIVPIKKYADFIIADGGFNYSAINELAEIIRVECDL
ncbi:MAG: uridine kinase [Candidatus Helarchaeota archaeon]